MQVIYLIRHGETDFNRDGRIQGYTESSLSDLGVEQARRVGQRLRGLGIERAFTSPLQRAVDRWGNHGSLRECAFSQVMSKQRGFWFVNRSPFLAHRLVCGLDAQPQTSGILPAA